jgi:lipopolysaccharide transport system ATP-binding protein
MNEELAVSLQEVSMAYQRRTGFLRYESHWALESVSFDVHSGETLGIIGRNGAGKSSLLRLLAGISNPTSGQISSKSSFISLLSLNLGFVANLSGRQNIRISGMLYGLGRNRIEELIPAIVDYSELGEAIDHAVSTYSAGMKARLGFATATVIEPDLLLIDEILGVGDLAFRKKSSATMRNRLKSDKTAIFVSHSMHEVRALCDRVVWLDEGKVRMIAPPDDVIAAYEDCLVKP